MYWTFVMIWSCLLGAFSALWILPTPILQGSQETEFPSLLCSSGMGRWSKFQQSNILVWNFGVEINTRKRALCGIHLLVRVTRDIQFWGLAIGVPWSSRHTCGIGAHGRCGHSWFASLAWVQMGSMPGHGKTGSLIRSVLQRGLGTVPRSSALSS